MFLAYNRESTWWIRTVIIAIEFDYAHHDGKREGSTE